MSSETYDVAVVGAGPAGVTTAIILARQERRVALLDQTKFPREASSLGWLNARVAPLLTEIGVRVKSTVMSPFREVTFHDGEFAKSTKPTFEGEVGYLADPVAFINWLVEAARKSGVSLVMGSAVTETQLKEDTVVLELASG